MIFIDGKHIAVVYVRYSSHQPGEQSIEGQIPEAYKYAAAHGLTILKEYCDRAMSDRNDNREQFQEMLKINKKAPYRTWNRADYILTDKLFCGHCGAPMVGESGTGKYGKKYNYYTCVKKEKSTLATKSQFARNGLSALC